ncbi:MAG: peptidase MA family metallohydrolase [Acetivibrionales bacterium]
MKLGIKQALIIFILIIIAVAGSLYIRSKLKVLEPGEIASRQSQHFDVYFYEIDSKVVDDVIKAGEENYSRITSNLGYDPERRIEIHIHHSRKSFTKAVGAQLPSWSVSAVKDGKIFIQSPYTYLKLNDQGYYDIFGIVPHEFTHLLTWEILTEKGTKSIQQIPAWFIEGIAYHEANQISQNDLEKLKADYEKGSIMSIEDLQTIPGSKPVARQYQRQSGWLIRYLSEQYGEDSIRELMEHLSQGRNFNDSLILTYSLSQIELDYEWKNFLKTQ